MHDVVIVGGGPVGLYLGILLLQRGLSIAVLEQRATAPAHSKAIGIHPPALEALDRAEVARDLVAAGVKIDRGVALSNGREIARLSFDRPGMQPPFILSVPQWRTEAVLERRLRALDPGALVRGARVGRVEHRSTHAVVSADRAGSLEKFEARFVIGADGARSAVRAGLGIRAPERVHPDAYLMGDFADPGTNRTTAVLHLEAAGVVESFPLPEGMRRWVVRMPSAVIGAAPEDLSAIVHARTGISPDPRTSTMLSSFTPRTTIARNSVQGRTVLIGDAAHEVSPIGGQGMNLGWLDAAALAPLLTAASARGSAGPGAADFLRYEADRRRAALTAARRAHVNMLLGRPLPPDVVKARDALLRSLFGAPPVAAWATRRFTMQ
ncbi:FAD-dependent monooxygenase [Paenarthrobacter sp. DKR-5]|uniref:FAD-dependent oxidoreductase n=1 Tax=Paenarthrobacter sp. DKR-5 TaxID=2835535 RepID=UPI001BDD9659|nr:NAD(P)/FAD-dependent oxidoreductase [Paenarthrobacter sp. DKR-5]MBT1004069.1 FAD-dependent monooxygenase [Paenarthrobacter sp. DKR-5]